MHNIGSSIALWFSPTGFFYNVIYFILVVGFTYFYTAVVFNPKKIAEEIQKYGGFIPGIRPGTSNCQLFKLYFNPYHFGRRNILGLIAIFPTIARLFTNVQSLIIGGTGILIVVSVILETIKAIEAQLVMRNYEGVFEIVRFQHYENNFNWNSGFRKINAGKSFVERP